METSPRSRDVGTRRQVSTAPTARSTAVLGLLVALVALVVTSLAASSVVGHAPSNPRDMETRLLTDQNDDCGGHDDVGCQGSHDLLALGLRERFDMTGTTDTGFEGTHLLVWSLWMSPGAGDAAVFSDLIRFQTPDVTKEIRVNTTDDQTFEVEAEGFVRVEGPYPLMLGGKPDGQRFGIDVVLDRAALGVEAGDALSRFEVRASVDGRVGDVMPGTYLDETGEEAPKGGTEQGAPAETVRPRYVLGETDRYLIVATGDGAASGRVEVQNRLGEHHQNVTFLVVEPDGATIARVDEQDVEARRSIELALEPRESGDLRVALPAGEEGAASVTLHYATDLGGHGQVTFEMSGAGGADDTGDETNEGSGPAVPFLVALLLLGLTFQRGRQRPQ